MKKTVLFAFIAAFCAAAAFAAGEEPAAKAEPAKTEVKAARHDCANCPMHKKMTGKKCAGMGCPEKMKGVETVSKNTENGVEITMTAKDKGTTEKIQKMAPAHYAPGAKKCPGCPTAVEGAETKYENVENGIKVTITGKTPEAVKQIQEASAREHAPKAAAKKYVCPMGCASSDKPGKCPKCGMEMKEQK